MLVIFRGIFGASITWKVYLVLYEPARGFTVVHPSMLARVCFFPFFSNGAKIVAPIPKLKKTPKEQKV